MAILAFATDPSQGSNIVGTAGSSTSSTFKAPNMQSTIQVITAEEFELPRFTAQDDLWFSGYHHYDGMPGSNYTVIEFMNDVGAYWRIRWDWTGNSGFTAEAWNGSSFTSFASAGVISQAADTTQRWDIHLQIADAGVFQVYVDGVLIIDFSGDTLLSTPTDCDGIRLVGAAGTNGHHWSGCFVADEDTRTIHAQDLRPIGAGNYTAWNGAYTEVDEVGVPGSDYIDTETADALETFDKTTLTTDFDSGYDFYALGISARAKKGASGLSGLQLVCRSGTTDGVSATKSLDTSFAPYQAFFLNDPDTAAAWANKAAMEAAEIGVKAIT